MRPFQNALYALLITGLIVGGGMSAGCARSPDADQDESSNPQVAVEGENNSGSPDTDVPYVPTPQKVVNRMLEMANVSDDDIVYDLGSGDGRIVITAAKEYGARGVGIEIDPKRIREARKNAKEAGVADRVEFRQQDLFKADISEATVVTLYLLPSVNLKVRPKLFAELKPGTPVVSHDFDMDEWEPEQTVEIDNNMIYRWTIPEKVPAHLQE